MDRVHMRLAGLFAAALFVVSASSLATTDSASAAGFYPTGSWPVVKTLSEPNDVAVALDGEVFVADAAGRRIVVLAPEGDFIREFDGTAGSGVELQRPVALALGPDARLYVADRSADRILVFERDGRLVTWWGSRGSGPGQFMAPSDLTFDASGALYVADTFNNRVQVFDTSGQLQRTIGSAASMSTPVGVAVKGSELFVAEVNMLRVSVFPTSGGAPKRDWGWATSGTGAGSVTTSRYVRPSGVEVHSSGNILVIDAGRNLVENCDPLTGVVAASYAAGPLAQPEGLFAAAGTLVFVADTGNNRIVRLDTASPATVTTFAPDPSDLPPLIAPKGMAFRQGQGIYYTQSANGIVVALNTAGSYQFTFPATPALSNPTGIALTHDGNEVWVCDTGNHRIVIYDSNGQFLRTMGSFGTGPGQFKSPLGVAKLLDDTMAVVDTGNNRIQVFYADGTFIHEFGSSRLRSPTGIVSVSDGRLFVTDTGNHRLAMFEDNGTWIRGVGGFGTALGQFHSPAGISVAAHDDLIVADRGNSRIQIIASDGSPITAYGTRGSGPGELYEPHAAVMLALDRMIIADTLNHRVGIVGYDGIEPVTVASGDISGWVNRPAVVTLSASDVGAGVEATYYRIGSGGVQRYEAPITIAAEGETPVFFWSRDRMGNEEAAKSVTVRVDTIPPSGTAQIGGTSSVMKAGPIIVYSNVTGAAEMRFGRRGALSTWHPYAAASVFTVTQEGTTTLDAEYRDLAGNTLLISRECVIDGSGPVTTVRRTPASGIATGPVTVDASFADAYSAVTERYYRIDGGAVQSYTGPFEVSGDGQHTVEAWGVDEVGNVGARTSSTFGISRLMLGGELSVAGGVPYLSSRTAEVSTTIQSAARRRWTTGPVYVLPWENFSPVWNVTFPADGRYTVRAEFEDALSQRIELSREIVIDTVAPVTTISGLPPTGASGGPVIIGFGVADTTPVVTRYSVDGGPVREYTSPFTVTGDAVHTIMYYSVDAAGNMEPARTATFIIEAAPPSGSMRVVQGRLAPTTTLDLALSVPRAVKMRFDTGSGPGPWMPYASTASVTMPGEGLHWIVGTFANIADVESQIATQVLVDLSPPTVSLSGMPPSGVTGEPVVISISARDTLTPISRILYSVDGGSEKTYQGPFTVTGDRRHTVSARAVDAVGNTSAVVSESFIISGLARGGRLTLAGGASRVGTTTVQAVADIVGALEMRWSAGGAFTDWTPFVRTWQVTLPGEGVGVVTAHIRGQYDVETTLTASVYVDLSAPVTRVHGMPPDGVSAGPVLVAFTATDASAVRMIEYSLDGGAWRVYTAPFFVAGTGTHTVLFRATDEVGNVEAVRTHSFTITGTASGGAGAGVAGGRSFINTTTVPVASNVPSATEMRFDVGNGYSPWMRYAPLTSIQVGGEGLHWVSASYRGGDRVESVYGFPVLVDLTPPVVTRVSGALRSLAVQRDGTVLYCATVTGSAEDSGTLLTGVGSISYRLGNKPSGCAGRGERAGRYRMTATATDRAGNQATRTGTVRFGASAPPMAPATARASRAFTVKGSVPAAAPGATTRLLAFKRATDGSWRLAKTFSVSARQSGPTVSVTARCALARGQWRLVLVSTAPGALTCSKPSAAVMVR